MIVRPSRGMIARGNQGVNGWFGFRRGAKHMRRATCCTVVQVVQYKFWTLTLATAQRASRRPKLGPTTKMTLVQSNPQQQTAKGACVSECGLIWAFRMDGSRVRVHRFGWHVQHSA